MRYIDLKSKDRLVGTPGNLGEHWNAKYLRAVQTVLTATRGVVGTKLPFFEKAFGRDLDEFFKILIMPEDYIQNRFEREADGSTEQWWKQFCDLNATEKEMVLSIVYRNNFRSLDRRGLSKAALQVLDHYATSSRGQSKLDYDWESMLKQQTA